MLREVHDSRPDGIFTANTQAEEAIIVSAAAILAVQGCACRLLRMVDPALFAAQEGEYQRRLYPQGVPALSPEAGESAAQLAKRMAKQG